MNTSGKGGFNKGYTPWNKGKKCPELGDAHRGKKHSLETKSKMSKALKGHFVSDETRRKIGLIHKGKIVSIESRRKMSLARKGYLPPTHYKKGHITWNKGLKGFNAGEKAFSWKGGRATHDAGYILIHSPNHPLKKKSNYVFEHRLIMEKHLGRYLAPEERVHHINEIKDDNRIENLMLFKNEKEHQSFHRHFIH